MAHSPRQVNRDPPVPASVPVVHSRRDIITALLTNRDLFDDIDNNNRPEADIRQRFLGPRAARANYVEFRVKEAASAYHSFMGEVSYGKVDLDCEWTGKRFDGIMDDLDKALRQHSRILKEDSRVAQAPVPDQYFVDNTFRPHIQGKGKGLRAPNAELLSLYGSQGEPIGDRFMTTRGRDDNFVQHVILFKLVRPFNTHIYIRCRKVWNRLFHGDSESVSQGFSGRTLSALVTVVENTMIVVYIAGSVSLLSILKSMKNRIIVTGFLSLAFPLAAIFLSKDAKGVFVLQAGFWAIMAVFIATSSYGSKCA